MFDKTRSAGAVASVLTVVLLVVGCGSSGSDGTSSVPLPRSKNALLDGYRAQLEQTGVPAQVAQCYADKIGALPDAEFKRFLAEAGQANLPPDLIRLNAQLHSECVGANGQSIDPHASAGAIQNTRQLLIKGMTSVIKSEGATPAQVACMTDKVNALPDSEIVKLSNSPAEARSVLRGMAGQCGGS
jgi:hypothetical protein